MGMARATPRPVSLAGWITVYAYIATVLKELACYEGVHQLVGHNEQGAGRGPA